MKCKTKPVSAGERLGAGCTNKANSRLRRAGRGRRGVGRRGKCAKRTQFRRGWATLPRPCQADYAKQNQGWENWGIWGTGRRGRAKDKCAKQTQFWPRQGEGQVVYEKGVTTNLTCKEHWKNKANFRPRRGGEASGEGLWGHRAKQSQFIDCGLWIVRNKANSQRSSRSDGCGTENCEPSAAIRHRMPATPASGMMTGIGFTGGAGRVTLGIGAVYGA